MSNAVVAITRPFDSIIRRIVISKDHATRKHKLLDEAMQSGLLGVRSDPSDNAASVTMNHSDNWSLGFLNHISALGATAHVHFVNYHRRSLQSDVLRHQGS